MKPYEAGWKLHSTHSQPEQLIVALSCWDFLILAEAVSAVPSCWDYHGCKWRHLKTIEAFWTRSSQILLSVDRWSSQFFLSSALSWWLSWPLSSLQSLFPLTSGVLLSASSVFCCCFCFCRRRRRLLVVGCLLMLFVVLLFVVCRCCCPCGGACACACACACAAVAGGVGGVVDALGIIGVSGVAVRVSAFSRCLGISFVSSLWCNSGCSPTLQQLKMKVVIVAGGASQGNWLLFFCLQHQLRCAF